MTAHFRNTRYPALRFYAGGEAFKFQGGRLAVEDEAQAEAIRAAATEQNGITEAEAPEAPEAPEAETTQDVLDRALELGILEEPMEAEDGITARIEDDTTLILTFADESTLAFRDGAAVDEDDEEAQDGQNEAAEAEEAANAPEPGEEPSGPSGDATEASGDQDDDEVDAPDREALEEMNRDELRAILEQRGLPVSGSKAEMVDRIMEAGA